MAIAPTDIRYIKLGRAGAWVNYCLDRGEIHFGHADVPHDLCAAGDWERVKTLFQERGRSAGKAASFTREVKEFYTLPSTCLWITFAREHLWWAFSEPKITWLGGGGSEHGQRSRPCISGWSNTDINGHPIRYSSLSSRLTAVSAYQQTICGVKAAHYLLHLINAEEDPLAAEAQIARSNVISVSEKLIKRLHWKDFEDFVELIFARNGWQRLSRVGGTRQDIDLELYEPVLGLRATAQIKSAAAQKDLDDYIAAIRQDSPDHHLFFVCHSRMGHLEAHDDVGVHIWEGERLAGMAVKAGLYDWLLERAT